MGRIRMWPTWYEMNGGCYPSVQHDETDLRFFRNVFLYFGINVPNDEDAAIKDLLAMAREGNTNAADMISYAIGYEPDSFKVRCAARPPEFRENQIRFWEENGMDWDETMLYGRVPARRMLEGSPEWRLLAMFAAIDGSGHRCTGGDDVYEDDVVLIRPYPPDGDEPTLVFKPSGYSMQWYKYPWRSPLQSENLSMGEIRRILRLAVEHIAYGRKIPNGTTSEILALPQRYLYDLPGGIARDLFETALGAPTNRTEDVTDW